MDSMRNENKTFPKTTTNLITCLTFTTMNMYKGYLKVLGRATLV